MILKKTESFLDNEIMMRYIMNSLSREFNLLIYSKQRKTDNYYDKLKQEIQLRIQQHVRKGSRKHV